MSETKKPKIDYTSRDFNSIKGDLVDYARRYYPETFRDFSVNSFGSLMLDTVSYVGDILSFYLDYQVNESFLTTATEYNNILKLSKQMGLKPELSPASFGMLTFFVLIPADTNGAPNYSFAPILKSGSTFKTTDGRIFSLLEDVDFADVSQTEVVVGQVNNETSVPSSYAVRAKGQAISGELAVHEAVIGEYQRFRQVEVPGQNITEVVSVIDSDGNVYFEVDYLTQNTIYTSVINKGADSQTVANILKPIAVPRRYVVSFETNQVILQFGFGTNEDEASVLDPSNVLTNTHGKTYITDDSFDPNTLVKTDSLGISPSNTVLRIIYRVNSTFNTNAGEGTINNVVAPLFDFTSAESLDLAVLNSVKNSLEVINEEAFVGVNPLPSVDELKQRAFGVYSMQNRIVTKDDLITATYNMPRKYGTVKKAAAYQDSDSFNQRNINLHVISSNSNGDLQLANNTIKNNLKTYLSRFKMINDTIDILDANIINLQIEFKIITFADTDKFAALDAAKSNLASFFSRRKNFEIGESFVLSDVFNVLKNTPAVLDVIEVDVLTKIGAAYANTNFNAALSKNRDRSGRRILCPKDSIFEIKFPNVDIVGTVE